MTLTKLKNLVAAYFRVAPAVLTQNSVDLFLEAANNVRRNAELLHDFEYTRVTATLSIDGVNGADLKDAVIAGNTLGMVGLDADLQVTGTLVPDATGYYKQIGTIYGAIPVYANIANNGFVITQPNVSPPIPWQIKTLGELATDYPTNRWEFATGGAVTDGTYGPEGSYTGTATVSVYNPAGAAPFSGIKSITSIQRARADGTYIPLDFTTAAIAVERERTEFEFQDDYFPMVRYPSDAQFLERGTTSTLIQRGSKIFVYPNGTETTGTMDVLVEGVAFYRDYTDADLLANYEGDLFLQYGSRYLQYAIICELNYYFQKFVPRQEGVLAPPEAARDMAWRDLLLWDSYLVDPASTRSR